MQTGQLSCVAGKLAWCCFGRLLSVAAPGGAGVFARGAGRRALLLMRGVGFLCTSADVRGCSFPLAGKNQRATGGSQIETAPWLPPDPSSLGLGEKHHAARG